MIDDRRISILKKLIMVCELLSMHLHDETGKSQEEQV